MPWKLIIVLVLWLTLKGIPCLAKGNPGRPPFTKYMYGPHAIGEYQPTSVRWRPSDHSTTRWQPGPTVTTTGATCRYGRRFGCCYGWRRDVYGRCQPICDRPCVHGTCVGNNQCQCETGYRGHTCARDVNECSSRPCQHRCMNTPGSFRCYCQEGYTLRSDKSRCRRDRRCESTHCSYGCQERGRYSVVCICPEGLRVADNGYSCQDIDECVETPSICPTDKRCHNTYGSHTCLCKLGLSYKFIDGKYRCSDEDECATRRHNCHRDAICINRVQGYTCECQPGFAGNGTHCVAIDPRTCANDPCFPNVICTDRAINPNSIELILDNSMLIRLFLCAPCPEGFIGDGVDCQKLPPKVIALSTTTPTSGAKIVSTKPPPTTVMLTTTTPTTAPSTTTVTTTAPPTTLATTAPPTTTVTTTRPPTTTVTTTRPPTTTVTTTAPPTTTVTTTAPPTTTVTTTPPPTTTVTTTPPPTTTVTTPPPTTTVTTTAPPTTTVSLRTSVTTKNLPTTTKGVQFFRTSGPDWPQREQPPASVSTTARVKDGKTTKPTPALATKLPTVTTVPTTITTTPQTTTPPTTPPTIPPTTPRTTAPPTITPQATTSPTTTPQTSTPSPTTPPTTPPTTAPPTTTQPTTTVPTTTVITTTTVPPTTTPPPPSVTVIAVDKRAEKALLPDVGIRLMVPDDTENATRVLENGTTGSDGMWKIVIPENTPLIITASMKGFLDTSYVYKFRPDEKNILTIEMTKPLETEEWSWKSGYYKRLSFGDRHDIAKQYRVEIAPGALDVIEGAEVTMQFTPVDMSDKNTLANVPELIAAVPNDQGGYDMEGLEVYAMAETSIYQRDTHAPIDVLLPVVIEMPLPEDLTDARHGQHLEAWYFDAETGVWMKAGKGEVEYYRGGVMIWRYGAGHFTWWAVGRTFPQTNCVVVYACTDAACNDPIPNVPVRLTGVDFFFTASKITDEQGRTCFHFKRQGQVKIDSPCIERVKYSQGRGKPSMCPADMNSEVIQTQASNTIDSCASVRLLAQRGVQTTCDDPGTPEGAIVVGSDYTYGGQVTYYCGPSSYMVGNPRRVCLDCGQWGGSNPTCEFVDSKVRINYEYPSEKPFSNAQAATTTESATRTFKPTGDQPKKRRKRRRRPNVRKPRTL